MNADLMRASRFEPHTQEGVCAEELDDLEIRHRLTRGVRIERDPRRIVTVAPDRGLDPPGLRARAAVHEGEVLPFELPLSQELLEPPVRHLRAGDDEEARRVSVEAMDDAGATG